MQAFVEPGTKFVNDSIRVNGVLSEAGLPATGASVRVTVEPPSGPDTLVNLHDDGAHDDGEANDGDYGGLFTKTTQAGVYKFQFRATGVQAGRPWVREAHRTKTVYDPRRPPSSGGSDGKDECCRRLIRLVRSVARDAASGTKKPGSGNKRRE